MVAEVKALACELPLKMMCHWPSGAVPTRLRRPSSAAWLSRCQPPRGAAGWPLRNGQAPNLLTKSPYVDVGGFCVFSAELVSVTVVFFLGRLVDDSRLGGVKLQP